jgi:hypothetical protein
MYRRLAATTSHTNPSSIVIGFAAVLPALAIGNLRLTSLEGV